MNDREKYVLLKQIRNEAKKLTAAGYGWIPLGREDMTDAEKGQITEAGVEMVSTKE